MTKYRHVSLRERQFFNYPESDALQRQLVGFDVAYCSQRRLFYLTGGFDKECRTVQSAVNVFNPRSGRWNESQDDAIKEMKTPRYEHSSCVLEHFLYAIAGR